MFYNESGGVLGSPSTSDTSAGRAYQVYSQIDFSTASTSNSVVTIPTTSVLLAEITLTTVPNTAAPTPQVGDVFTVSLNPICGDGSENTNIATFFDVFDPSSSTLEDSAAPFTSSSGTVTIGPAIQSIPEPASAVYVLMAVPLYLGYWGFRAAGFDAQREPL